MEVDRKKLGVNVLGGGLHDRTWIHRGGDVNIWFQPLSLEELETVGNKLYGCKSDFVTIGHTSNIYFRNTFNIDYVIDTRKLNHLAEVDGSTIECWCGTPTKTIARYCVEHGYSRYEGLIDLPGTIAGAVVNNAGCFGCGIDNVLKYIEILKEDGTICTVERDELNYRFRNSSLKDGTLKGIILRVFLDISEKKDCSVLKKIAEQNHRIRLFSQDPPSNNLGSTINVIGNFKGGKGLILRMIRKTLNMLRINKELNNKVLNLNSATL